MAQIGWRFSKKFMLSRGLGVRCQANLTPSRLPLDDLSSTPLSFDQSMAVRRRVWGRTAKSFGERGTNVCTIGRSIAGSWAWGIRAFHLTTTESSIRPSGKTIRFGFAASRTRRLKPTKTRARKNQFRVRFQADLGRPDLRVKIFRFVITPNQSHPSRVPPRLTRGVSRSSRNVRRDAVDADVSKTNDTEADGEVVWSWRPKAGAKFRDDAFASRRRR
ncbi:hypothetical protein [Bradyrhizobium sp. ARR65]|uniref:hypothetical protein n=1 Tax=Bradyrhizobium sp. ARR65 TaxID=1040989 RepID=UPI000AFE5B07|nr:hypothetical protein [Bradyrhizobium sp. ARR65]